MRNLLFVKICLAGTLLLLRYTQVHRYTQIHSNTHVHRYTQILRYTTIFYKRCKQLDTKENLFSYAYNKPKIKKI